MSDIDSARELLDSVEPTCDIQDRACDRPVTIYGTADCGCTFLSCSEHFNAISRIHLFGRHGGTPPSALAWRKLPQP